MPSKTPPWDKKRPAGPKKTLSTADKARARARARRAGRSYPNLVDNLWAAEKPTAKPKARAKAKGKKAKS